MQQDNEIAIITENESALIDIQSGNDEENTIGIQISSSNIIRSATVEEAIEGTSEELGITPKTLKAVTHYVHTQGVASDVWTINHNLNKKPSITVVDTADNVVEGAEKYIDENTIEIYFNGSFKGKAYLN